MYSGGPLSTAIGYQSLKGNKVTDSDHLIASFYTAAPRTGLYLLVIDNKRSSSTHPAYSYFRILDTTIAKAHFMPSIFTRRRNEGKRPKNVRWNVPLVTGYISPYGSPPVTPMSSPFYWPAQAFPNSPYNGGFVNMNRKSFLLFSINHSTNTHCLAAAGTPRAGNTPLQRRSSFTSSFTAPQWAHGGTPLNRWGSLAGHTPRFTSAFVPPPTPQASHTSFGQPHPSPMVQVNACQTPHVHPGNSNPGSPWHTPQHSPSHLAPALPAEPTRWEYTAGTLIWSPHPAPHPHVPASEFWNTMGVLQGPQPTPRVRAYEIEVPLAVVSGGCPMPGSAPWWNPGTWPPSPWGTGVPVKLAPW